MNEKIRRLKFTLRTLDFILVICLAWTIAGVLAWVWLKEKEFHEHTHLHGGAPVQRQVDMKPETGNPDHLP